MSRTRLIAGYVLVVCGAMSVLHAVMGMASGQVFLFSKRGLAMVNVAVDPQRFWLSAFLWAVGGIVLIVGGYIRFIRPRH